MRAKLPYKKIPLACALVVACVSSLCAFFVTDIVSLFLLIELASAASFYLLLVTAIPAIFPSEVKPGAVFIGGVAKPPYISKEELFRPATPLTLEETSHDER
ncbi:TPA: hypothetical protein EYP44_03625 [Candidatus Bathyarchaeota archaeon]|nr:hypothetical protein [Candidatus Bathyarchaeota archaeon]